MTMEKVKYSMIVEWWDEAGGSYKEYMLTYWVEDGGCELWDLNLGRCWLRRTQIKHLSLNHFYRGAVLSINAREWTIIRWASAGSKLSLGQRPRAVVFLPAGHSQISEVFSASSTAGLVIAHASTILPNMQVQRSLKEVFEIYKTDHQPLSSLQNIPYIACVFEDLTVIPAEQWVIDELTPLPEPESPPSLNAPWGVTPEPKTVLPENTVPPKANYLPKKKLDIILDRIRDPGAIWSFALPEEALHIITPPPNRQSKEKSLIHQLGPGEETTLTILKPHAVCHAIPVLNAIEAAGLQILSLTLRHITLPEAKALYLPYKLAMTDTAHTIEEITKGDALIALLARKNALNTLRNLAGPFDAAIAQQIEPQSLRAKFGVDRLNNALHCTDITQNVKPETDIFFP